MRTLLLGLASFFLLISAASAQSWTAAGSAGAVDESALSIFQASTSNLGYSLSTTSTSFIVVRYAVDCEGDDTPSWTTFEMLANNDSVTNGVIAILYSIDKTNGNQSTVATISSSASSSTQRYSTSVSNLNCANNYYVVEVEIGRVSSSSNPRIYGVRLY